jgi:hypothetical protein
MKKLFGLFCLVATSITVTAQQKVGIGTNVPQQRLSIDSTLNIDQGNYNLGATPSLRFGSASGEGIGSRRPEGVGRYGLDFYTNNINRIRITSTGMVGIGTTEPEQMLSVQQSVVIDQGGTNNGTTPGLRFGTASGEGIGSRRTPGLNQFGLDFYTSGQIKMQLSPGGNLYIGSTATNERLNVNGNISANAVFGTDVLVDRSGTNDGNFLGGAPALIFGSTGTGEGIQSQRTAGPRQYGIDFFAGNNRRMTILNNGTIDVVDKLTVNNGKGIIRSTDGTQLKKQSVLVTVNIEFTSQQTRSFNINWPEAFAAKPDAWVADVVSGTGGWAEMLMTIFNTSTSGCVLYAFNPRNTTFTPNFQVRITAIGP